MKTDFFIARRAIGSIIDKVEEWKSNNLLQNFAQYSVCQIVQDQFDLRGLSAHLYMMSLLG